MTCSFKPKSSLEKFGFKIYLILVENFPRTYFVGGTTRDLLLYKKITDLDIATSATPAQVVDLLKKFYVEHNLSFIRMGIVIASEKNSHITIATLRRDLKSKNRYPKIHFVKTAKTDSKRRDFTINALYLSLKNNKILDFHKGLMDLKNKKIKFIGLPEKRIKEDPLRIIRALRIALKLDFKLEKSTKQAILNNFSLTKKLTNSKIQNEISKLDSKHKQCLIRLALEDPKRYLDNHF